MSERKREYKADLLGILRTKLGDLSGFYVLANELIQNADDAPNVYSLVFDVCDEALVVENDGVFREKDFNRIASVASGGKVDEDGTTGNFGIGFISVYQITDRPELFSSARKWVFEPEKASILEEDCEDTGRTRFILPWARDPDSAARIGLQLQHIDDQAIDSLFDEFEAAVPAAMPFLRKLTKIELRRNGTLIHRVEAERAQEWVTIQNGERLTSWRLFRGSFGDEASELRNRFGVRIETKRSSDITIAVADSGDGVNGLLYAFLPTQHHTGLPVHINADFYPSSSRKDVLLEDDYRGQWNAAALTCAAEVIADATDILKSSLGHVGFWDLVERVKSIHDESLKGNRHKVFQAFWETLKPRLQESEVVWTFDEQWRLPGKVFYRAVDDEAEEINALLSKMENAFVHPDLRRFQNNLLAIGTPVFSIPDLAQSLKAAGLDHQMPVDDAPDWMRDRESVDLLAREIERLLARQGATAEEIETCSISLSIDGELRPPNNLWRAENDALTVFSGLGLGSEFADLDANPPQILALSPSLRVQGVIKEIVSLDQDKLEDRWKTNPAVIIRLVEWFKRQHNANPFDEPTANSLAGLSIWPSQHGLHKLADLVVPGDFKDPLGLANVASSDVLKHREFLLEMGANELTVDVYARTQVPAAFENGGNVPADARRELLRILIAHSGQLSPDAIGKLKACPIVECTDKQFRQGSDVYFETDEVKRILGRRVHFAVVPNDSAGLGRDFLTKLGVAETPKMDAVVGLIRQLSQYPANGKYRRFSQQVLQYLGSVHSKSSGQLTTHIPVLKQLSWLPAKGDHQTWHSPSGVYADYQEYLFSSQARFLDLQHNIQTQLRDFIGVLAIPTVPAPEQVVAHLLECAKSSTDVNREVYQFLTNWCNNKEFRPNTLTPLRNTSCLLIDKNRYVSPQRAFWDDHRMGTYCVRLGDDWRKYQDLLAQLGVRPKPLPSDAINIITEISDEFGSRNAVLDNADLDVLRRCWEILADSPDTDLTELADRKVIPNDKGILYTPGNIFFEDKPGLRQKYRGVLMDNVILRPPNAWMAMERCGVRPISKVIDVEVKQLESVVQNDGMTEWIRGCRNLIARVVASSRTDPGERWNLDLLRAIVCAEAPELTLVYTLRALGREWPALEEHVAAHYDPETQTLYYRTGDEIPWTDVARELAYALNPDPSSARISAAVRDVLSARSPREGAQRLDSLGIPRVQELEDEDTAPDELVGVGGTDGGDDLDEGSIISDENDQGDDLEGSEDQSPVETDEEEQENVAPDDEGVEEEPVSKAGVGSGHPGASGGTSGLGWAGGQHSGATGGGSRQGHINNPFHSSNKPDDNGHGRRLDLESWPVGVFAPGSAHDGIDEKVEHRNVIDQAGIERVLAYEEEQGRFPQEMPHFHPGYDIESKSSLFGEPERFIEVKSRSGPWDVVALTAREFEAAQEKGEKFWLYVVERADQDDCRIIQIQNPAGRANKYLFTSGWSQADTTDTGDGKGNTSR